MSNKAAWERLYPFFDPLVPAGDPEHAGMVRVEHPYSPVGDMQADLEFPQGHRRELIVGAPGAGKTTELLALLRQKWRLNAVLVDLRQHFEDQRGDPTALNRLQAWEVLVIVGLAVHRYGSEHLGHAWTDAQTRALRDAIAEPVRRRVLGPGARAATSANRPPRRPPACSKRSPRATQTASTPPTPGKCGRNSARRSAAETWPHDERDEAAAPRHPATWT